jgi:hypothetical protein
MRDEQNTRSVRQCYTRTWLRVALGAGTLLVLTGASVLFSFVHQVDWRVCAGLCRVMLLAQLFFLAASWVRSFLQRACRRTSVLLTPPGVKTDECLS